MTQRADLPPRDVHRVHREKLELGERSAVQLVDDLPGIRALNLITVELAHDRFSTGDGRRSVVLFDRDVVAAGLCVELNPIGRRRAPDEHELILRKIEENAVADHASVVAARHKLLRSVDREVLERIDRQVGEELQRIAPLHEEIHHVVALVVQNARFPPAALLVPPVRVFSGDHRVDIGPDL